MFICGNNLSFRLCRFITVVMFVFMSISVLAEQSETPDPLFQDDATLEVTLEYPLTTLVRKRPSVMCSVRFRTSRICLALAGVMPAIGPYDWDDPPGRIRAGR